MTFINVYGSNVVFSGDPATAAGLATVRLVKKTPGLGLFEVQVAPWRGQKLFWIHQIYISSVGLSTDFGFIILRGLHSRSKESISGYPARKAHLCFSSNS